MLWRCSSWLSTTTATTWDVSSLAPLTPHRTARLQAAPSFGFGGHQDISLSTLCSSRTRVQPLHCSRPTLTANVSACRDSISGTFELAFEKHRLYPRDPMTRGRGSGRDTFLCSQFHIYYSPVTRNPRSASLTLRRIMSVYTIFAFVLVAVLFIRVLKAGGTPGSTSSGTCQTHSREIYTVRTLYPLYLQLFRQPSTCTDSGEVVIPR